MKRLYVFLFFLIFIKSFSILYSQTQTGSFEFEGQTRDYIVFLPQNYQLNMPVILNLHGYGSNAQEQMNYTLMNNVADTAGFIVVYPNAISPGFNSGAGENPDFPTPDVNDVGFIDALIDTLNKHYSVDLERIYVCGMSNGGFMSYKLACELSNRFAAIASVTGVLSSRTADNCNSVRAMPVLQIHGTEDDIVPLYGDMGWLSVDQTINYWTGFNGCLEADTLLLPDLDTTDGCTVEKISYSNCSDESKVSFYKIINGGHTWPGAVPYSPLGKTTNDIIANVEIWNFFKNYKNPLFNAAYGKSMDISHVYFPPDGDTLIINAHLFNPEDHLVTVYAKINGDEHGFLDSIELIDDGLHDDGETSDNIWGGTKWLSDLEEDMYLVELYINDLNIGATLLSPFKRKFTTAGPVEVVSYETSQITEKRMRVTNLALINNSSQKTIRDLRVDIFSNDTSATIILGSKSIGDLAPGESKTAGGSIFIDVNEIKEYKFIADISSDDVVYWTDTIYFDPTVSLNDELELPEVYALNQNYPNPFNPATTIKYSIPAYSIQHTVNSGQSSVSMESGNSQSTNHPINQSSSNALLSVKLVVYDILGKEVATLVNEHQRPGSYSVNFDASSLSSGVYFYKLTAGQYVDTKKLMLVK